MGVWLRIIDAIADIGDAERRYRRENPGEFAADLRDRQKHWKSRGRHGLARVAGRRAERWEKRAARKAK